MQGKESSIWLNSRFSFAYKMIFAAAHLKNGAAVFSAQKLRVFCRHIIRICRRNVNGGGGIRRDFNLPIELLSVAMPFAADETVGRVVSRLDEFQVADGSRSHRDMLECGLLGIGFDSCQVFVEPDDIIADEHHVIAGI